MRNSSLVLVLFSFLLMNMHTLSYGCGGGFDEATSRDLIRVVSMGYAPDVKRLLEIGQCDVNYINEDGDTALSVAARRNDLEIMQLLITYGANPKIGMGLPYLIMHANIYGNQQMLSLLAGFGCNS